jgi:bis(5'-nucleosyl)-tetraphosphatase (symmetrical)
MATYAIGDIQGCYDTLEKLLDRISFSKSKDRLWLTGDLVNRGPRSLQVLRWAYRNRDQIVTVLGNHDLHLIACAMGAAKPRDEDTFGDVLKASDGVELINWLRRQPFLHRQGDRVMVHAGFHSSWTLKRAEKLAAKASARLQADKTGEFADLCRRPKSAQWHPDAKGLERAARAGAILVRIRGCRSDGELCEDSGAPDDMGKGCKPWFKRWDPPGKTQVIFGHWSALGFYQTSSFLGLDTGCVWGHELTAVRLDDDKVFSQPAVE